MATVVKKDPTGSVPVGNGQVIVIQSANTPDFSLTDWLINPNLSALTGVPVKYWKITGGTTVEEMTSGEKALVDAELTPPVTEFAGVASVVSTTTSTTFQTKLEVTGQKAAGEYLVFVSYGWNFNSTTGNFEARVQEDVDGGGYANIGEDQTQEPSDSGGTFGGTGTDQKFYVTRMIARSLTEGVYSWRLEWRSTVGGVEASIWDAYLVVMKRFSGVPPL